MLNNISVECIATDCRRCLQAQEWNSMKTYFQETWQVGPQRIIWGIVQTGAKGHLMFTGKKVKCLGYVVLVSSWQKNQERIFENWQIIVAGVENKGQSGEAREVVRARPSVSCRLCQGHDTSREQRKAHMFYVGSNTVNCKRDWALVSREMYTFFSRCANVYRYVIYT